jgi:hypothetical protein
MDAYEYRPIDLEGPAFRLLRLLKGVGSDIKCELFEAWLGVEDLVHYEAVSYTWGGTELSASVEVDGRTLNVTESLYLALHYLRIDREDRILWVDAICIDQSNRQERGHQVRQMGGVYSQADRVVVWLGPATDDTNVLMDSLNWLEQESIKLACRDWALADRRWQDLWTSLQLELKGRYWNLAARQCAGLELLLQRPWFKRIWILQEVANAKRAIVCSGTRSVSSRIFVLAPSLVHIKLEPGCQAVLDIMPGPSRRESWWNLKPDLYTLLLKFSGSKAGDPRDMIYALLGICSDAQDACIIPVDYRKEPEQVVRDAAFFLFGLSDCSYGTVPELMNNVVSLNSKLFLRKVESEDGNRIRSFLRLRAGEVKVTEEVVKAAAGNTESGEQVMQLLLDQRGGEVKVTKEVVEAAAGNTESGEQVMQLLLTQRGGEMLLAAALGAIEGTEHILRYQGGTVRVTEEVVKAAAGNWQSGRQVMTLLLEQRGDEVKITEEVVKVAAGNWQSGEQVMTLLLEQRGGEVKITEEVVKAAASNRGNGEAMMALLLEQRGGEVKITEEVVKAAAGNWHSGEAVIALLLKQRRGEVKITEEVVKAAAGNWQRGRQVMALLLKQRGGEVKITEEVVKAAAGN